MPRDRDRDRNDRRDRSSDRGGDRGSRYDRGDRDSRGGGNRFERGNSRDRDSRFGETRDRNRERSSERSFETSENMTRLAINIGRNERIRPGDIVGAIAGESGINGKNIGNIEIKDRLTYVYVPKDDAKKVLDAMNGNTIKGHKVNLEKAE